MTTTLAEPPALHDLTLERRLSAPRAALWRCWTEADLLSRWFTPAPWTTHDVEIDLRPGGTFSMTMRGPNGESHPNSGIYLEVVPGARLVFTDAYVRAWEPSAKPFFTGVISFEDDEGGAATSPARATGPPRTRTRTPRWGFTRAGARRPTSSRRWRKAFSPTCWRGCGPRGFRGGAGQGRASLPASA